MQVSALALMPQGSSPNSETSDGHREIVARLKSPEFLLGVLRSLVILALFVPSIWIAVAVAALVVLPIELLESLGILPSSLGLPLLVLVSLALATYVVSRLFASIPMTIAENTTVRESLQRSWHMTKRWKGIFVTNFLLFLCVGVLLDTAGDPESSPGWWAIEIIFVTLLAVLWVCLYNVLRRSSSAFPAVGNAKR